MSNIDEIAAILFMFYIFFCIIMLMDSDPLDAILWPIVLLVAIRNRAKAIWKRR